MSWPAPWWPRSGGGASSDPNAGASPLTPIKALLGLPGDDSLNRAMRQTPIAKARRERRTLSPEQAPRAKELAGDGASS